MALIGAFALLQWLKGRNIIKDWENIVKTLEKWGKEIDKWTKTLILLKYFSMIINIEFTSNVEIDLDLISLGEVDWKNIIKKIYVTFNPYVIEQMKHKFIKKDKQTYLGYELKTGKYGPYLTDGSTNYNLKNYFKYKKISIDELNDTHVKHIISYPKKLGEKDNLDILICLGPYGEYMKYNNKNYKINKRKKIDLEYCLTLL